MSPARTRGALPPPCPGCWPASFRGAAFLEHSAERLHDPQRRGAQMRQPDHQRRRRFAPAAAVRLLAASSTLMVCFSTSSPLWSPSSPSSPLPRRACCRRDWDKAAPPPWRAAWRRPWHVHSNAWVHPSPRACRVPKVCSLTPPPSSAPCRCPRQKAQARPRQSPCPRQGKAQRADTPVVPGVAPARHPACRRTSFPALGRLLQARGRLPKR